MKNFLIKISDSKKIDVFFFAVLAVMIFTMVIRKIFEDRAKIFVYTIIILFTIFYFFYCSVVFSIRRKRDIVEKNKIVNIVLSNDQWAFAVDWIFIMFIFKYMYGTLNECIFWIIYILGLIGIAVCARLVSKTFEKRLIC